MANVFDVAKYILSEIGDISTMKLQKLCYYSLVKGIVAGNIIMFPEKFEAWVNGPVCRELWNIHKGAFYIGKSSIPNILLSKDGLDAECKRYINDTLEKYSSKSGTELSEQTHREQPWIDSIRDTNMVKNTRHIISYDSIKAFYSKK